MKKYRFLIPLVALVIAIPLAIGLSSSKLGEKVSAETLRIAENAITKAAVQCYALEGFYPPDLAYLVENYGIAINEDVIYVDYIHIGSNLLPDVTVIPVQ